MKLDVSEIQKTDSASLNIEYNGVPHEFKDGYDEFLFNQPMSLTGQMVNIGGILKLDGRLKAVYTTRCYRCLRSIKGQIDIAVKEAFSSSEGTEDSEVYTFDGKFIELDDVIRDKIILHLPMRQLCDENCKGLCSKCGTNLNEAACECEGKDIDPRMEALKDFFNK